MRALLIGVGNAGCRIIDMLTAHDLKSSVKSVRSYIFNADREFLNNLEAIDLDKRILLLPKGLDLESCKSGIDFDLSNITKYLSDTIVDEADAVFICAGLGGRMGEALPQIIAQLNLTLASPIFTILTIPARNEGARVSARAAAELEEIRSVASASIIFDNETWIVRLEEERAAKLAESREIQGEDGIVIREPSKLAVSEVQDELNELLTRRVELLLRAGEITPNGIETAEAVLDAGEVLNTLTDTDIVSIGYAAEQLPKKLLGFLNRFRMEKYLLEEGHKRTARIVNLAKRAVYEEVSVPCDLTTANKALVLITGPSNELSMKGFQTIRKWIDNSIKGLEMRAGDYPVKSTKDVGVIIVLAGIENVPRIAELNEIRASYDEELKKKYHTREDLFNEEREPEIRNATDTEIFEEGEVLSISAGATGGIAMGTAVGAGITYAGITAGDSSSNYEEFEYYNEFAPETQESTSDDNGFFDEYPEEYESVEEQDEYEDIEYEDVEEYDDDETEYLDEQIDQNPSDDIEEDDDIFTDDDVDDNAESDPSAETDYEDEEEDVFEDKPVSIPETPIPDVPAAGVATGAVAAGAAVAAGVLILPKSEKKKPVKRKSDPQITLAGKKKKKEEFNSAIPLPKRNKQPDMVLAGQADLGKRKVLNEGMDRTSIGSAQRPKETDTDVSIGPGQRPKETDGIVSIGSGQRPKETDGIISIGSGQRPKETDGAVSIGSGQRPKETDGNVSVGVKRKPNDNVGNISVGVKQKPKDNTRNVSVGTRMKPNDNMGNVSVGTKLKPKDNTRSVSVGTRMKPNDSMDNVSVGAKQTPKEIGNVVKVTEKKPLKSDVWKAVREAQQKRESSTKKSSGTSRELKWM